ncbi:MAG: glutathione S-transferase family protein [Anaeromyxobacteraceae bacterium]
MDKPTIIYFAARGRAEIIRLALAEAGVEWQEHPIGKGTPPLGGRPTDFAALKATGDLPYEAAPVWEEPNGLRLAQSAAIAYHVGRAHGLLGRTPLENARCDELWGAVEDLRLELRKIPTAAPEKRAAVREELATASIPRWLGFLERTIERNGSREGFGACDVLTVADLALWYALEIVRDNGLGASLSRFPRLSALFEKIARRPRIAAYLASPRRPAFVPLPT